MGGIADATAEGVDRGLSFGEEMMIHRRRKGLSIEEAASLTGLSTGAISEVERGRRPATPRTVAALVDLVAVGPEADRLATLAAETYRRLEFNLASLDRERIELVVQFRRLVSRLTPEAVQSIRSALASAG